RLKRKKLQIAGFLFEKDTGRPETVYGPKCKQDNLAHNVKVTELEVILKKPIQCDAKVGRTQADGVMDLDGRIAYVEVDYSGKMTVKKQMRDKWKRYAGVPRRALHPRRFDDGIADGEAACRCRVGKVDGFFYDLRPAACGEAVGGLRRECYGDL